MCSPIRCSLVVTSFILIGLVSANAQVPEGRLIDLQPISVLEDGDYQDCCVALSPDGLELLVTSSGRLGLSNWDLYQVSRPSIGEAFEAITPLDGVNTDRTEGAPFFSSDGLTLYFLRTLDELGNDLYQASRKSLDEPFGDPVTLGPGVNTTDHESGGALSADGLTLYFARGGIRENADLWQATRASTDQPFANAEPLGQLNSDAVDIGPQLSGDGLHLVFGSERTGTDQLETFVASRTHVDQPFGPPVLLDAALRLNTDELRFVGMQLSPDWPAVGSKAVLTGIAGPLDVDNSDILDWDLYEATWVPEPSGATPTLLAMWAFLAIARRRRGVQWNQSQALRRSSL